MTNPTPLRRSLLLHGLRLLLREPRTLLYPYAANLGVALAFSLQFHSRLAAVLDHSLEAQRLSSAFDLGVVQSAVGPVLRNTVSLRGHLAASSAVYLAISFVLVPGALFCFQSGAPAGLRVLIGSGLNFFWRFVRITLLTLLVSLAILAPLLLLQALWIDWVETRYVERTALLLELAGAAPILLVAALLRLYFDLVEAYTVLLGEHFRPSGVPDRRVRKTLLPALRALGRNLPRAYGTFLLLTAGGIAAMLFAAWTGAHRLAQPRVWPLFLVAQAGLFCLLASRYWQRTAALVLAVDNPLPAAALLPIMEDDLKPIEYQPIEDAQSDPEPAVPSLDEPDPAVFHHEVERGRQN